MYLFIIIEHRAKSDVLRCIVLVCFVELLYTRIFAVQETCVLNEREAFGMEKRN